jgi:hypothetical protein
MPRYILIDNDSGFIWGDSADLDGKVWQGDDALAYAKALDESMGEHGRSYEWGTRQQILSGSSGYFVYRADIDGSEAVPVVHDGQDQYTIRSVIEHCREEGFIVVARAEEGWR